MYYSIRKYWLPLLLVFGFLCGCSEANEPLPENPDDGNNQEEVDDSPTPEEHEQKMMEMNREYAKQFVGRTQKKWESLEECLQALEGMNDVEDNNCWFVLWSFEAFAQVEDGVITKSMGMKYGWANSTPYTVYYKVLDGKLWYGLNDIEAGDGEDIAAYPQAISFDPGIVTINVSDHTQYQVFDVTEEYILLYNAVPVPQEFEGEKYSGYLHLLHPFDLKLEDESLLHWFDTQEEFDAFWKSKQ